MFANQLLEKSYDIIDSTEHDDIMEKILDTSSKSSSLYREEVEMKLDQLNKSHVKDFIPESTSEEININTLEVDGTKPSEDDRKSSSNIEDDVLEDSEPNAHGLDLSNVNSLDEASLEKANMVPVVKLKSLETQLKRELRQNPKKEVSVKSETENTKAVDVKSKEVSVSVSVFVREKMPIQVMYT